MNNATRHEIELAMAGARGSLARAADVFDREGLAEPAEIELARRALLLVCERYGVPAVQGPPEPHDDDDDDN